MGLANTMDWGLAGVLASVVAGGLLGTVFSQVGFFCAIVTFSMSLMPKQQRLEAGCEE